MQSRAGRCRCFEAIASGLSRSDRRLSEEWFNLSSRNNYARVCEPCGGLNGTHRWTGLPDRPVSTPETNRAVEIETANRSPGPLRSRPTLPRRMSNREVTFRGGPRTIVGFGVALVAWVVVFVQLEAAVADASAWVLLATELGEFATLGAITLYVLRVEGVRPVELGLTRRHLVMAVAAFGGLWVALNLLGIGVATITDQRWSLSLLRANANPKWAPLPASWVTTVLLNFLVVGLVEEFVVRGYFQTRVIAVLGDGTRLRTALGIVAASVLFGALHTPGAALRGASLGGILGSAALPALTGLLFGAFYEWTHNVYFVAMLHGLGNTWPLVVDWSSWSGTALITFWVGTAVVYLGATMAYRYRTGSTDGTPVVDVRRRSTRT